MVKRVLLTGGTGFVGANLARRLLHDGYELHLLVRRSYQPWRIDEITPHLQLHVVDFGDAPALTQVVAKIRPEWVFHLAAYGAYSTQTDLLGMIQTNLVATVNLVNACLKAGFEAFVNTGSSSEYGFKDHPPREDEWVDPNSHYAVTKVSATQFCRYTAQSFKILIPTLRLYSVYGPFEEPTRLIPTLIAYGLDYQLPRLVNPDVARDYVYIDDVSDAYLLAASVPNQEFGAVYNVGTGLQTTLRQVVSVARAELQIDAEPVWGSMPQRMWDTNVWIANNEAIRAALHWLPKHSFAEGFNLMANWLRADPDRARFYYERRATPT